MAFGASIVGGVLGSPPTPPSSSHPLSLKNPGDFEAIASAAGFLDSPVLTTSRYPFDAGTDEEFQFKIATVFFMVSGCYAAG